MGGISGFELAKKVNKRDAVVAKVNDQLFDLCTVFNDNECVSIIDITSDEALPIIRHSTAHLLAHAVKELFPECNVAIGPEIKDGFYYDFDCSYSFSQADFDKIEARMKKLIKDNLKIERLTVTKDEAKNIFSKRSETYKLEILESIDAETVTLYKQGDYYELCKGPHVPSTGVIPKAFKLLKVAGAYWRGDSKNKMLQRIYATAWRTKDELDAYLHMLEEAEKRDHRKIAKEMDLFHMQDEAPGCIFWHHNGWILYNIIKHYMRKRVLDDGYIEVCTPQMLDRSLWEASGHWEKYRENMFIAESEGRIVAIKPMNCPGAIQIFNQGIKSYRDLPLRMAEFGCCHRNEPSGSLYGSMRVRGFVQDDAHIFCTLDQISEETKRFCNLLSSVYRDFGFDTFSVKFSDRPEKRAGSDTDWDLAEKLLQQATVEAGLAYTVNKGEGAFYGPKLEFVLKDKLGRDWQCGTLQVDFQLPYRLNAFYVGEDGERHHPVMLHRAVLGSFERFVGILLENYAGWLPLWLTPVQVVVATITNAYDNAAASLVEKLKLSGIRCALDTRAEKISYKIREHTLKKVPMIAIIGEKEATELTVTVRLHDGSQRTMPQDEFVNQIQKECSK